MALALAQGKLLWKPDAAYTRNTRISAYLKWLEKRGQRFDKYSDLWRWSVEDLEGFWGSVWKYFDVSDADYVVLEQRKMPGAKWFQGADVNFAERVFRSRRDGVALVVRGEKEKERTVTWQALEKKSAALASYLREAGVVPGDRVAACLPNGAEAVIGLLACSSIGAVWSSCSPEFGAPAVADRFGQISPKVLIAADGYAYGGKWFGRAEEVKKIVNSLPSVTKVISVRSAEGTDPTAGGVSWEDATSGKSNLEFEPLQFDHPLWILYSSGTTGLPKPIVHSQGGITIELLKELSIHNDIREGDRFFWFTTTGWMMWNYLVGGLLHGATVVLYNGSPNYPTTGAMWELAEKTSLTFLGTSAAHLTACMKSGLEPQSSYNLRRLRGIGSTGSPLPREAFEWVYSKVKGDVWLASLSGGTDVCTAFVGGTPTLPVCSGEIQCRCLGAKVEAYDPAGRPVQGQMGELVVTEPMPSMPVYFWGDKDGKKYEESYFSTYPGVWRHGDWIEVTERGTCIIYGRSDATLKRSGVRIGTSEIYRAVESVPGVVDSLAVDRERQGGDTMTVLFLVLAPGTVLDSKMQAEVKEKIRRDLSPKHLPDMMVQAPSIPKTLNGKKLEVPVKRILAGGDPEEVLNRESLADPGSIDWFVEFAKSGVGEKA